VFGHRYDNETQLYYLQSRYYNPEWGRFINADGLIGNPGELLSANMFPYCGNNPVNTIDPTGECWWIVAGAVIGAVVGMVTQGAYNVATGQDWTTNIAGAALGGAVTGGILAATGGTALVTASFVGAAVTSVSNEVESYVREDKKVTENNVVKSVGNVATSTLVSGTANLVGGKLGNVAVPTRSSWFTPTKLASSFTGKYAQKIWAQTAYGGLVNTVANILVGERQNNINSRNRTQIRWDSQTVIKASP
jgi:RHS repeat-associated protein